MNCAICKKKLKLAQATIGKCKCNDVFCNIHIHNHQCPYDFKKEHHGLDPWVQWVSIHTGKPSSEHKILELGKVSELK